MRTKIIFRKNIKINRLIKYFYCLLCRSRFAGLNLTSNNQLTNYEFFLKSTNRGSNAVGSLSSLNDV